MAERGSVVRKYFVFRKLDDKTLKLLEVIEAKNRRAVRRALKSKNITGKVIIASKLTEIEIEAE